MTSSGIVNIRGKDYQTVALRVQQFRERLGFDWAIETTVISIDEDVVVVRAVISDPAGYPKATGHAEEKRAASTINRTSALENCETSAIGRALAALGFGGEQYATAEEIAVAIDQGKGIDHWKAALADSIAAIKDGISSGDIAKAAEAWAELSTEEKRGLWVAPSKGGPFTTEERRFMKEDEGFKRAVRDLVAAKGGDSL